MRKETSDQQLACNVARLSHDLTPSSAMKKAIILPRIEVLFTASLMVRSEHVMDAPQRDQDAQVVLHAGDAAFEN